MKSRKMLVILAVLAILTLALSACGSPNSLMGVARPETGVVYGFWNGLWDGFTVIFAFIGSLFGGQYNIYEVHNNGGWYNFGYILGLGLWLGGGTASSSSRRS